jgi:hypothetical protein
MKIKQIVEGIESSQGVAEGSNGVSVRGWANQVRKDYGTDVKFFNRKEGGGAVDSVVARNSQGETVGVYNRKTGYPTVFEPKQSVAEGRFGRPDAYERDVQSSQTGFGRREREDDEYHVPDPIDDREEYTIKMMLSKDGGPAQAKQMKVKTSHGLEHATKFAHQKAEEQGWKVVE